MSSSAAFVQALVNASLETLWPAACAACDRPIPDQAVFCGACELSINPLVGACPGCALPLLDRAVATDPTARCGRCRRVPLPF
ncbi:MAG TPA: double zinc ribbon domain-containing protein, partial [Polyangia bacterium]|nr:double zinc ribbon domain-containing protein [Polyangia bacterium]